MTSRDSLRNVKIEEKILELLSARKPGATICPSEVARALEADGWRELMPQIRQVAQVLADAKRIVVTRSGASVDATEPGGPIRLGAVANHHPPVADGWHVDTKIQRER